MSLNRAAIGRTYSYPADDAYEVGRELIRKFADAVGDTSPLYRDREAARAAGHRDVLAPPTFLTLIPYARVNPIEDPDVGIDKTRGVHAEHRFEHHRPIHAGDRIMLTTTIVDMRCAGPHEILDLQAVARTVEGELLSTITHRVLFRGDRPGSAGSAGVARVAAPVAPDPAYLTQRYSLVQQDLLHYAGASGEYEPIHWSERAARAAGLPGVIAHGMYTMTKAAQALTTWFGDPARVRDFGVRFAAPLVVRELEPTQLTVAVRASEPEADGGLRVHLDVRSGGVELLTRASAVIAPA